MIKKSAFLHEWVAFFTTDLDFTVKEIIEHYGAHCEIEAGFKGNKQEIGSLKSQARNSHAVTNHFNFRMMAATITWIYADYLEKHHSFVTLLTIEATLSFPMSENG